MRALLLAFLLLSLPAQAAKLYGTDFESGTLNGANAIFPLTYPGAMSVELSTAKAHSGARSMLYHPSFGDSTNPPAWDLGNQETVYAKWWWWIPKSLEGGVAGHHAFRITKRSGDCYGCAGELDSGMGVGGTGFDFAVLTDKTVNGFDFTNLFNTPQEQWFQFEVLTVLNTVGQANGILKAWINGTLVYSNTKVIYRKDPNWRYNTFLPVTNIDGASAASYWYMDDMEAWNEDRSGGAAALIPPVLRILP